MWREILNDERYKERVFLYENGKLAWACFNTKINADRATEDWKILKITQTDEEVRVQGPLVGAYNDRRELGW